MARRQGPETASAFFILWLDFTVLSYNEAFYTVAEGRKGSEQFISAVRGEV